MNNWSFIEIYLSYRYFNIDLEFVFLYGECRSATSIPVCIFISMESLLMKLDILQMMCFKRPDVLLWIISFLYVDDILRSHRSSL